MITFCYWPSWYYTFQPSTRWDYCSFSYQESRWLLNVNYNFLKYYIKVVLSGYHTTISANWLKKNNPFCCHITLSIYNCYGQSSTMKSCLLIPHLKNMIHKNSGGAKIIVWMYVFYYTIMFRQSKRVRDVQEQIQKFGDGSTVTKVSEHDLGNLSFVIVLIVGEVAFTS